MNETKFKPYVPEDSKMPEFTVTAVVLGVVLAAILGAANAWLGMKAGQTIAATFPAAVVAMAILRFKFLKGNILQENLARTAASVGEALVAGAIFTIPAFVIVGYWDSLLSWDAYLEGTALLLVGGVLGVLFVILLRRTLVNSTELPFPESVAAAEIHKAGQKGATGAKYVFGALGISMLIELFKNDGGIKLFKETIGGFYEFASSKISILGSNLSFGGGLAYQTPAASPALMGVGFVIGPRLAAITFSGGLFAWAVLIPLILFMDGSNGDFATLAKTEGWMAVAGDAWFNIVRPLAVGSMLVGAFWTLWGMRSQLLGGIGKAFSDMKAMKEGGPAPSRIERDLSIKSIFIMAVLMIIPITALYYYFSRSFIGAITAAVVMMVAGFLFAAVAGYLVGIIGSSSNPISGLTITTVLIAALLMVALGVAKEGGDTTFAIAAVLGVAAVVCCACGVAGDMMQDLKVGHILGGTPWKMEVAEIISVVLVSFVLILPIGFLHASDIKLGGEGIGGATYPAPQAGLMAMLARGIVSGEMAWPLVFVGMGFAVGLILIKSPSPMLVAVGMYLPLQTTFAIFVGGMFKVLFDKFVARKTSSEKVREKTGNTGLLVASGLIAGEALTGVILAIMVMGREKFPFLEFPPIIEGGSGWLMLAIFGAVAWALVVWPLGSIKKSEAEEA
jgi:putative OPT family oligopeptide transporter